jgi:hypothetical protein
MCRVPITDAAVPTFSTEAEFTTWTRANRVEVAPDHIGRSSIDLPTAYRLHADASARAEAHARAEAERIARDKAELAAAQDLRQSTYMAALAKARSSRKNHHEASQKAWDAVAKVESNTPDRIRHRLAGVSVPVGS